MTEPRFSGQLVDDHELVKRSRPPAENNYAEIIPAIRDHFRGYNKSIIFTIEIGSGDGDATEYILRVDPRTKILAVDPEPKMIERLEKRFRGEYLIGRVVPSMMKISEVASMVSDNTVDLIVSALTLHNFHKDERHKVLESCYRMLSPGGLFINHDKYMPDDPVEFAERDAYQRSLYDIHLTYGRPDIKDLMLKHHLGDIHPDNVMKENESLEEMAKIGFKNSHFEFKTRIKANMVATK